MGEAGTGTSRAISKIAIIGAGPVGVSCAKSVSSAHPFSLFYIPEALFYRTALS
jgi:predicted NAD/FAD-binding protein